MAHRKSAKKSAKKAKKKGGRKPKRSAAQLRNDARLRKAGGPKRKGRKGGRKSAKKGAASKLTRLNAKSITITVTPTR